MPDKKKSNKRKWIIISTAVLFIVVMVLLSLGRDNKKAVDVETEKVSYKTVIQKVNASGTIQPEKEVNISSSTSSAWIDSITAIWKSLKVRCFVGVPVGELRISDCKI